MPYFNEGKSYLQNDRLFYYDVTPMAVIVDFEYFIFLHAWFDKQNTLYLYYDNHKTHQTHVGKIYCRHSYHDTEEM